MKKCPSWVVLGASLAISLFGGEANAAAADAPSSRTVHLTLRDLGSSGPIELRGIAGYSELPIGSRGDEVVTQARLHLRYSYSPSMLPELSHLRISLNGEPAAALPLPRETAGHEISRDVELNPQYFADFNHLRLQLVAHYTQDCEDPGHTALWATISDRSELELELRSIDLANDLALLPAPFFDRRDSHALSLPVVLPHAPSLEVVRDAGIVASWFGRLAEYRRAEFPVRDVNAVARHALVFATNRTKPDGLALPDVTGPTVRVLDNPGVRHGKLLLFMGRDEAELRTAVLGLVLGDTVLSGAEAQVHTVTPRARVPYDTPRWLRTDRPVRFAELVDSPQVLEVHGRTPDPIRLNLRLPPDLMAWRDTGLPIDLHFRYTAPVERDASSLTVEINDRLARVIHLRPDTEADGLQRLMVPLVSSTALGENERLALPGVQIGADNVLSMRFAMDSHVQGACRERMPDVQRSSIDPDSTIDLTGFRHYVALPNLALFAHAGYPFTRLADLSQTVIVLKDGTGNAAVESFLQLMGQFGRWSGVPATGVRVVGPTATDHDLADADILVMAATSDGLLGSTATPLGVTLGAGTPQLRKALAGTEGPDADVAVSAAGSVGVMEAFASPYGHQRSVVALLANDTAARSALSQALETRASAFQGDVVVVRGETLHSYRWGTTYYVGDLPWGGRVWAAVSRHPLFAIIGGIVLVSVLAFLAVSALRRRAARRLSESQGE